MEFSFGILKVLLYDLLDSDVAVEKSKLSFLSNLFLFILFFLSLGACRTFFLLRCSEISQDMPCDKFIFIHFAVHSVNLLNLATSCFSIQGNFLKVFL